MKRSKRNITKPKPIESSDEDDFEEVKPKSRKPKNVCFKESSSSNSDDSNKNKEKASQGDDSSSESDIETYLTHPDELNLNSTFFKPQQATNESFDDIEKRIFSGVNRLSESDSSETEDMPLSKVQTIENEKPKMNFEQLHEYTRKIEEAKRHVEKYMAKKRTAEKSVNVTNLLAAGEKNGLESSTSDLNESFKLNTSEYETLSDSEKEDWEEVADKIEAPKSVIPKEGVQITLEMPNTIRKKKGVDLVAAMKRRLNSIKKVNQVYIHKTHLLCWIAHGIYVNNILNDKNLLGLALSLIPSQQCYPSERTDLKYLEQILGWYRRTIKIVEKASPKNKQLDELLSMQIDKKEVFNYKMLVYIFVCILRSLGIQCRLVLSLQIEPLRPPASELNSLSTKVNKKDDEKNEAQSTSKVNLSKLKVTSKKKNVKTELNKSKTTSDAKAKVTNDSEKNKKVSKTIEKDTTSKKTSHKAVGSKTSKSNQNEETSHSKSSKTKNSKELPTTSKTTKKVTPTKKSEEIKSLDEKKKPRTRIAKKIEDTIKTLENLERGETISKIKEDEKKESDSKIKVPIKSPKDLDAENKKPAGKLSKKIETAIEEQKPEARKTRSKPTIVVTNENESSKNARKDSSANSVIQNSPVDDTVRKTRQPRSKIVKTIENLESSTTPEKKPNLKRLKEEMQIKLPLKSPKLEQKIPLKSPKSEKKLSLKSPKSENKLSLKSPKSENLGESSNCLLDVDDFVDKDTWRRSKSSSPDTRFRIQMDNVSKDDNIVEQKKVKTAAKRKPNLFKIKLPMKKKKDDNIPQVDGLYNSSSDESVDECEYYEIPRFIQQLDGADDEKPSTSRKPPTLKNLKQPPTVCPIKKHPRRLIIDPIYKDEDSEEEFSPRSPFTSKNISLNTTTNKNTVITKTTLKDKINSNKLPKAVSDTDSSRFFGSPKKLDVRNDIISLVKTSISEQKHAKRNKLAIKSYKEDSDSDYAPEEFTKKKERDDADQFVKKVKVKKRVLPKSVIESQSKSLNEKSSKVKKESKKKPGIDVWVEVFLENEEKWISADVVQGKVHCIKEIFAQATHPISYILSWDNTNRVKDITKRYCPNWNTVTRKLRTDQKWWDASLKPYLGVKNARDKEEDEDLARQQLDQPLPKTITEYKDHPLYVLQRHLLKFQAIYPPDAVTLGFIRGEPVYSRDCVYVLHSRDIWLKSAKTVKPKEEPYKIVKARPKYDRLSNTMITDQLLEIFGEWQIEDYVPPTAENGVVPRNAYGNVDLFKSCMLPKKTVHLQLPGLNKVAKKMNIDCASAVTGFDFHSGWSHPTFDGFVVCEEFADELIKAWYIEQEEAEKREKEKYEKRVFGNWRRLIKGLMIRERLKKRYDFGTSKPIPATKDKKKKRK